jgi:hypothetical protein
MGVAGSAKLVRDSVCPLDPDIDNDGLVSTDVALISDLYGVDSTNSSFVSGYDINCDNIIDVRDIVRVGFQYLRR